MALCRAVFIMVCRTVKLKFCKYCNACFIVIFSDECNFLSIIWCNIMQCFVVFDSF